MLSLQSFYRGKRVVVTGHTGFKGAWLTEWLKLLGADVYGYSLPPEPHRPSLFEMAHVADGTTSLFADVRDRARLVQFICDAQPEIVFHLAAQPLVRRSYRNPLETYETNVMGTAYVLDALRSIDCLRSVVVITSDKCYDNQEWDWSYRETDHLGGYDPYSSSKACAEIISAAYRRSFFSDGAEVGIATARAGNVVGGGDWSEDRIVPDIVRALGLSQPIVLRNPDSCRPWQHVLDPLRGYLMLAERLWLEPKRFSSAWNFGPAESDALTVGQLTERFVQRWGAGTIRIEAENNLHEAQLLRLDSRRAARHLGWETLLTIDEVVDFTIDWYRTVLSGSASASDYTREQILSYAELAAQTGTASIRVPAGVDS